jgi:hypothetical protein
MTQAAQDHNRPKIPSVGIVRSFDIPLMSVVVIEGREYFTKEKLGEKWVFIDLRTEQPRLFGDDEIARLSSAGCFFVKHTARARNAAPIPWSPLLTSERAHEENLRKHEYVKACRELGEHFRRSRLLLEPVIAEVAAMRGEAPPGFTTVLSWLDKADEFGNSYGTAALSNRYDLKGKRGSKLAPWQESAVEIGLATYLSGSRMTMALAYSKVCEAVRDFDLANGGSLDKGSMPRTQVDKNGALLPPSLRTFERRCNLIDRFTRDYHKKGPRYAANHGRTYATTPLPSRPYEEVEVDHTRLDLFIVDEHGHNFGRPDLIVFGDRATAMIVGYSIGFEEPSYTSFMNGLRHTTYFKDLSAFPAVQNPWPCHGRIENLFVDNALHFIGNNIENAGRELGFNVVQLPPRSPWLKGAIERFFGTLNIGLNHLLPGTTLENVLQRREHELLGESTLTLAEFEGLLTKWICDDYHVRETKGLGVIRGVGDIPLRVWNKLAQKTPTAFPPDPDLFTALAGDSDWRTIQRDGIVWDYIKYEGPQLSSVLADPRHGVRREGRSSTKNKVVRDPYRLSEIKLVNHHTDQPMTVEATAAHKQYASSVTLHQHRVIIARARERVRGEVRVEDLQRVRNELADVVLRLLKKRPQAIQRKLARFLQTENSRRLASTIQVPQVEGTFDDFLDLTPKLNEPRATVTPRSKPIPTVAAPHNIEPSAALSAAYDDDGDLSDLEEFSKRKGWSVFDGRSN